MHRISGLTIDQIEIDRSCLVHKPSLLPRHNLPHIVQRHRESKLEKYLAAAERCCAPDRPKGLNLLKILGSIQSRILDNLTSGPQVNGRQ